MTGNEEKEESSTFPVVAPAEVSDSIIPGRGGFSTSCQPKQVKECKHHACYRGNCSAFPPPSVSRACLHGSNQLHDGFSELLSSFSLNISFVSAAVAVRLGCGNLHSHVCVCHI